MMTHISEFHSHPEYSKRFYWLEDISEECHDMIYSASTCLLAASEGDGFGLPLINAAQHNMPIITRDIPEFREVAGEHAFYFSGHTLIKGEERRVYKSAFNFFIVERNPFNQTEINMHSKI